MWRCGGDEILLTKAKVKLNLVDSFGISENPPNQSINSQSNWCARWFMKASIFSGGMKLRLKRQRKQKKQRRIAPLFEISTKNGRYNTRRKVWRIPRDLFCHGT
jgi:hypothetical protein